MTLDASRIQLTDTMAAMAREGVRSFTADDLERSRCDAGVSRAWMNYFLEDLEHDGTTIRLMGRLPRAWRFTDEFRLASGEVRAKARARTQKAKTGE